MGKRKPYQFHTLKSAQQRCFQNMENSSWNTPYQKWHVGSYVRGEKQKPEIVESDVDNMWS